MINQLRHLAQHACGKGLVKQLVHGGIGGMAIKVVNMLLGLVITIILARYLGSAGYGVYAYVIAFVSILAIPAQFGFPKLVVRETAKAQVNEQWGLMLGVWRWSSVSTGALSVGFALIASVIIWLMGDHFSELQIETFMWGLVLVPLTALSNLRCAALQGLHRVVISQLPESILRPGLMILLVFIAISSGLNEQLTAEKTMSLHVLAAAIAFFVGIWLLRINKPRWINTNLRPVYRSRAWVTAVIPLALASSMQLINQYADILMIGIFEQNEKVGVYRVVVQGATLVVFGLQVVNILVSPYFAYLHTQGDRKRLQRLVTLNARVAFLLALPIVTVIVLWGKNLLRLVFGEKYVLGYAPLAILAVGQLVNATFGSVSELLNMSGHERDTAWGIMISAGLNILLNLTLIPLFGINGAAMATAITLATWNLLLWRLVHLRLGLNSMAIPIFRKYV